MARPLLLALVATTLLAGSTPSVAVAGAPAEPSTGGVSSDASAAEATDVRAAVAVRRVLLAGPRPQTLTFTVPGTGTAAVVVELARSGSVSPVARWELPAVPREAAQTLTWDGATADGRGARDGRYRFRVGVDGGEPAPVVEPFDFFRAFFPVRGPHSYGDGLGAGRGHQGQDVLAACGTPLLAARGGTVEKAGFEGAAGNMVVVDVVGSPSDMVYMHLRDTPEVEVGDTVTTGQRLGAVGSTGRSSACHLHFELWSGPGYLTGGRPVDPVRQLRAWDRRTGGGRETPARR
jgi:murein DD-endopeptidase MepM/ murein hydrolase activator NlpD